nr:NAD(P)H-hydrate dehydratase [[Ruminococcus] torques]
MPGKQYQFRSESIFSFFEKNKDVCITYDPEDIPLLLPKRAADSHKGDYGKILMITGSKGMAGAAYLSAKAAYAVGAGLVQIYTAEENRTVLQELLPEAIISCYNETAGKPDDKELEKLIQWADVICIGCGLGTSVFASRLLKKTMEILRENGSEEEKLRSCPCIIDADGLNLLSMDMEQLQGVPNVILTPHMKEMSRLINKEIPQIAERRFSVVKEFTEQYQVVCALKDSRTVVMKEGHHPFLNLAGNSAMAKAGSGDVLAGMISGLAAQKTDIFDAVSAGVYFHACGGDEARKKKGSYSVLARDLIDGIGQCLKNAEERL